MRISVHVERGGTRRLVGHIETVRAAGERFVYDAGWLAGEGPRPLSLSLPLQPDFFPTKKMRPYFDGLLPEGAARDAIAKSAKVSARSYVKLLAAIGGECIGAVSFAGEEEEPPEGYVELSSDDLEKLAGKSYRETASINKRARMSLAGAQAKVGLYRSESGRWFEPRGDAPSTHILKPLNPRFANAQINEAICQRAAALCGLPVPETEIIATETPLYCVKRFDRVLGDGARVIDGQNAPLRLHQEDFCQALGIVPERKYEESNKHYLGAIAQLIREHSTQPLEDLQNLWSCIVFNYLIGNCDAHLKNIGLIRDGSWRELTLAPFYDLVCTTYYDGLSSALAMSIGGKRKLGLIDRPAFEREAESLRLSTWVATRAIDVLAGSVPDAVRDAARELSEAGYSVADAMGDDIARGVETRAHSIR